MYAQVVFPLPFRNSFTYSIPDNLQDSVQTGVRVVVPFGKRTLTGFVIETPDTTTVKEKIKPIRDVLDDKPIFTRESLKFYEWISEYYISSLGEALKNSVPYGLDVESKKTIVGDKNFSQELYDKEKNKNSTKAKILKALTEKEVYKISQLQKTVKKKSIYSTLTSLEKIGAVTVLNQIEDAKVRIKKVKYVKLVKPVDVILEFIPEIEKNSPKQTVILLELISNKKHEIQQSELLKKTKANAASVTSLEKKELVEVFDKEVERVHEEIFKEELKDHDLTEDQQRIIDEVGNQIDESKFKSYLLHGVTGSGKTQVYIELAKKALAKNKTVLILVPEISLTPQITSRFYNNFGKLVTVMHSRMSLGERYDSWRNIVSGKYKVVIGPRSALFAPLNNTGLIVVDEEHDSSYKQYDMVPKYHARDAAILKAHLNNCPVVLGSATPSIESKYNAQSGKFSLLELKERVDNAKLPNIKLVDLTLEKKRKKLENSFSVPLIKAIQERLNKKEGIIILQNRRGFSTQIYCEDCGTIHMCSDCTVPMVHHIDRNIVQCHYCGIVQPVPRACNTCGSINLKFFGTGTQKVEEELEYYFPDIKIERIDSDSINKKNKLSSILNRFKAGEIGVLVGTQMVSKGLDFSNVTLVGVISAETTLWLPDFRADERTFQLLTQVAGRAGRSKTEGEVIIQTHNNKHFVLQKVLQNDYHGFYEKELALRHQNGYPPFTRLCLIEFKDETEKKAIDSSNLFYSILKHYSKGLEITQPSPAAIARIKAQYRYQILIKSSRKTDPNGRLLRNAVLNSYIDYNQKSKLRDVKIIIDIDPQSLI
ncbi:MAG: primosomal protein N' [Ignavibacteria bacterium]